MKGEIYMYKLLKEKGNNMNLVLENTETKASIIIGRLSVDILRILKEGGIYLKDEDGEPKLKDAWCFTITDEMAQEISARAMPIEKPVRLKKEEPKKNNKSIDALDVLLGLANYNQKGVRLIWKNYY